MENTMKEESEIDIRAYEPPNEWQEFAFNRGIKKLLLVDDERIKRSFRFDGTIYLNIRRDYWENYCLLMKINSYEEAMTCKLLHQLAHLVLGHRYVSLRFSLDEIGEDFEMKVERLGLRRILEDASEKEAWEYVFQFRQANPHEYITLVEAFKKWLEETKSKTKQ
jgi:hypothetical protein